MSELPMRLNETALRADEIPDGYCLVPAGMAEQLQQLMSAVPVILRKLQELENSQGTVTITHEQVKKLAALIRLRADEYSEKYSLSGPECRKAIRAAIKKDVLTRAQVKDLHDLPAIALPAVENQVRNWTGIRLVISLRNKSGGG